MKNYLELGQKILDEGTRHENRTGTDTIRIEAAMLEFDLRERFPLVTTRKIPTKGFKGETVGFIRAYDNAALFRALGCNFWNANANENKDWLANPNRKGTDDLGRIYGVQWRKWRGPDGIAIDQLAIAIDTIMTTPTSRRIIVDAWNPGELHLMALPPCHRSFHYIVDVDRRELSLVWNQRSCDYILGIPSNIASYGMILEMTARATGYKAKKLIGMLEDVHIYVNHIDNFKMQLQRQPLELPKIHIADNYDCRGIELMEAIQPDDVYFDGYSSHPAIDYPMAV